MNKGIIWLSAAAFTLSVSTTGVFAMPADETKKCPKYEAKKRMFEKLNLTEQQKSQIEAIKNQYKEGMKAQFEEAKKLRKQMKDLVKADRVDENQLNQLVNQKKEIMGALLKSKIRMKNQIYHVLNEEQRKQYQEMMEKKMRHMEKKHNDKTGQGDETGNQGVNLMDDNDNDLTNTDTE